MIAAVVATRNEPEVGSFVHRLYEWVDEVIVCDESTDGGCTEWNAHAAGASVLRCTGGIGPSLMRGWELAFMHDHAKILQIDAGGSHSPEDIPKLDSHADITIGSRFVFGATYTGRSWRSGCSRAFAFAMDWRSGEHVADWTSGYRCFTREAVETLLGFDYRASMHGWQAEVLLRAFDAGMTVKEVPISYRAGETALRARHVLEAVRIR
jgi:dolichol-phosphate mannosyltransferase